MLPNTYFLKKLKIRAFAFKPSILLVRMAFVVLSAKIAFYTFFVKTAIYEMNNFLSLC